MITSASDSFRPKAPGRSAQLHQPSKHGHHWHRHRNIPPRSQCPCGGLFDNTAGNLTAIGNQDFAEHLHPLKRQIVMFAPGVFQHLVFEHGEGTGYTAAGVARHDHIIDKAASGRDKGIGEFLPIIFGPLFQLSASSASCRKMIRAAPSGPITAISAVGQA